MTDQELPPPYTKLPGCKVTPQMMAKVAYQVSALDPAYMTMGDDLGLQIAYESVRAILQRHARTPRAGGGS